MNTAFRYVTFENQDSTSKGMILFDTGCRMNLISENHPIIVETTISKSKTKIKMQGAFGTKQVSSDSHVILSLKLNTELGLVPLKDLRFDLIPGNITFTAIFGLESIIKHKIRVGFKTTILHENEDKIILNHSEDHIHLIGSDESKLNDIYYVESPMLSMKTYIIKIKNQEFPIKANTAKVPKALEVNNFQVMEVPIIEIDELTRQLSTEIINHIETIQSENCPKLPTFDLNKIDLGAELTDIQISKIRTILNKYKSVFSNDPYDIGLVKAREYSVETSTNVPQRARLFPLSREAQKIVHDEIKKLIKAGILERIDNASVISSTFLPIKSPDGSYRLVRDFRSCNSLIINCNFSIRKLTDSF